MRKQAHYSIDHPVAIALSGMVCALRTGGDLLVALAERAEAAGVRPYSDYFDDAARLAGLPYCRALDLYVDRETKRRADRLGAGMAHLAFLPA
ncbi:MAG: hypothetical protein LCH59_00040 [Proteobacteria bacterium]|jgi:hypothetical protein|nr:hypothetical protein [Pseudomonadota bacterium]